MHVPASASGQLAGDGGFGVDGEDVSGENESGLKLWETKYRFQKEMLPSFVGEVFGRKVCGYQAPYARFRLEAHSSSFRFSPPEKV